MSDIKRKKHRRHGVGKSEGAPTIATPLKASLVALPITLIVGVCLLLAATALLLSTKDPNRYHGILALPILYLTAFLGGMIATRIAHRYAPFLCGISLGLLLVLLFSLLALILPDALSSGGGSYIKFFLRLVVLPASLLGSCLGAKEKKHKRRRR